MSASWDDAQRLILINAALQQKLAGKWSDTGIKKEGWLQITTDFNLANVGKADYKREQLQSHYNLLKGKLILFNTLLKQSWFGWNSSSMTVTASPEIWDKYIEAHPKAKEFRLSGFALVEELTDLFEISVANGQYALPATLLNSSTESSSVFIIY